jgi:hypothetical protein
MKKFCCTIMLLFSTNAFCRKTPIVSMDFIKVKNGHYEEALFFFENNWKLYRDSAMKSGAIKSYKLLRNNTDSSKADIILMTEYFDKDSYLKREEIFRPIMKSIHPNGGVSKNNLKRDDILTIDSNILTEVLW